MKTNYCPSRGFHQYCPAVYSDAAESPCRLCLDSPVMLQEVRKGMIAVSLDTSASDAEVQEARDRVHTLGGARFREAITQAPLR